MYLILSYTSIWIKAGSTNAYLLEGRAGPNTTDNVMLCRRDSSEDVPCISVRNVAQSGGHTKACSSGNYYGVMVQVVLIIITLSSWVYIRKTVEIFTSEVPV